MATHSSVLAWRIPGTGEPGGLTSLGSHRVRHDWSDLAAAAALLHTKKPKLRGSEVLQNPDWLIIFSETQILLKSWDDPIFFFFFFTVLPSLRNLSSPTRDWTWAMAVKMPSPNHWHHWFKGHELGQTLGNNEGQEGLLCYSSWGHKESNTT